MLDILWSGAIAALIGAIPSIVGIITSFFPNEDSYKEARFVNSKYSYITTRFITLMFFSILSYLWTSVFLYTSCKAQTILTVIMWMWPVLLINIFVIKSFYGHFAIELIITGILLAISVVTCLSSLLQPVQNMIYIHDTKNIDISYSISSDEILARMDISILNGGRTSATDKYAVDSPEMRKIDGKDIAVYHIKDRSQEDDFSEYIPGYIILEDGETPKVISKRIYFDYSYIHKKDALRTVRRAYPTVWIGDHKFDVDDNYNPYEIYEYRENLFFSNGEDYGIIVLNLQDGTATKYTANEVPSWVDFKTTYPR